MDRLEKITQPTETENYLVQYNKIKQEWELRGKRGSDTYFMKGCRFQTPLLITQRELEAKRLDK